MHNNPMENLDLIELQKQLDGITPGEWMRSEPTGVLAGGIVSTHLGRVVALIVPKAEDRDFIAAAPNTVRKLMTWLADVWQSRLAIFKQKEEAEAKLAEAEKKLRTIKQICAEGSGEPEVRAYLRSIDRIIEIGEADPRF